MNISNKLKELREEKNQTALIVAKNLNITRSAYSNYEQGTRQPDYDTLIKIAKYFQVSTDYLLGIEDYDYNFQYEHNDTKLIHKEKK